MALGVFGLMGVIILFRHDLRICPCQYFPHRHPQPRPMVDLIAEGLIEKAMQEKENRMPLQPKDLLKFLEKGDRSEEHLKTMEYIVNDAIPTMNPSPLWSISTPLQGQTQSQVVGAATTSSIAIGAQRMI